MTTTTAVRESLTRIYKLADALSHGNLHPEDARTLLRAADEFAELAGVTRDTAPVVKRRRGSGSNPTKRARRTKVDSGVKRYDTPSYCRNDGEVTTYCFKCREWHTSETVRDSHNFVMAGLSVACRTAGDATGSGSDLETTTNIAIAGGVFTKLKARLKLQNMNAAKAWSKNPSIEPPKRWSYKEVFQVLVHLVKLVQDKNVDIKNSEIVDLTTKEFPESFPTNIDDIGFVPKNAEAAADDSSSDDDALEAFESDDE